MSERELRDWYERIRSIENALVLSYLSGILRTHIKIAVALVACTLITVLTWHLCANIMSEQTVLGVVVGEWIAVLLYVISLFTSDLRYHAALLKVRAELSFKKVLLTALTIIAGSCLIIAFYHLLERALSPSHPINTCLPPSIALSVALVASALNYMLNPLRCRECYLVLMGLPLSAIPMILISAVFPDLSWTSWIILVACLSCVIIAMGYLIQSRARSIIKERLRLAYV